MWALEGVEQVRRFKRISLKKKIKWGKEGHLSKCYPKWIRCMVTVNAPLSFYSRERGPKHKMVNFKPTLGGRNTILSYSWPLVCVRGNIFKGS